MKQANQESQRINPIIATLSGILFVSTASIFIRFAQSEASSIVIAAARLLIASVVLVPIALVRHWQDIRNLSRPDLSRGLLSGVFLALHFAAWITSLEFTSVASSVVLVTTTPLWVALLSPLLLHEKIKRPVIIGLMISMLGSVIVGLANACGFSDGRLICQGQVVGEKMMLGNFLALFGAWMAAGYMIIGRKLRKSLNVVPYTAIVYGSAALILSIIVLVRSEPVFSYSRETYMWLLALGIIPQLLGHSLFNWALRYISAAYVSLTLLGEPIGTVILAMIFLKESPTFLEGIGAVLILIGIVIGSVGKASQVNAA